jgi:hypothetical protein
MGRLGFTSQADPDVWFRLSKRSTGEEFFQKWHVAATQDMQKEAPTYPFYTNKSRQVQVSPNVQVP